MEYAFSFHALKYIFIRWRIFLFDKVTSICYIKEMIQYCLSCLQYHSGPARGFGYMVFFCHNFFSWFLDIQFIDMN